MDFLLNNMCFLLDMMLCLPGRLCFLSHRNQQQHTVDLFYYKYCCNYLHLWLSDHRLELVLNKNHKNKLLLSCYKNHHNYLHLWLSDHRLELVLNKNRLEHRNKLLLSCYKNHHNYLLL